MKKSRAIFMILILVVQSSIYSQEIYIDSQNGVDSNIGSSEKPFKSILKALSYANSLTGTGSITLRLYPGLYLLDNRADINPVRIMTDSTRYTIEAVHMPDDDDWSHSKMPKIQSVSSNNSETYFPHAIGFLVSSNYVTIRGLKFLGAPNPMVPFYYPISKKNQQLKDLEVSQCYFIGDKESAPIQAGLWVHGPNSSVTNCIFYECRNGVLFFYADDFKISNSIIYGAYESAFWLGPGPEDYKFTFTNNIIANNENFIVGNKNLRYSSNFSNSVIANNQAYIVYGDEEGFVELKNPNIKERQIIKYGKVKLKVNNAIELEKSHLHLTNDSTGKNLRAGIFKKQ